MSNVVFTQDFLEPIRNISYELKRMNDLKEKELKMKYDEHLMSIEVINKILSSDGVPYHFECCEGSELLFVKNKED